MKNLFDFQLQPLFLSFLSWLIPLSVSMFLVNPETKQYLVGFWGFKLIMTILFFAVVYFSFRALQKRNRFHFRSAHTFLLMNVVLDAVVLLNLFKMPFSTWLTTVLPIYIMGIYGTYAILKER